MYIPKVYQNEDRDSILAFMRQFNFAIISSLHAGRVVSTHLPFVIQEKDGDLVLISHFAFANPQWKEWAGQEVLVVFSEPHAFISPSLYQNKINVPTWNYVAVHAYGTPRLITDTEESQKLLMEMIAAFDPNYTGQWEALPDDYKQRMLKGIMAFEITVTEIQGKQKLSQNKPSADRDTIIDHLSASEITTEQWIGEEMQRLKGAE